MNQQNLEQLCTHVRILSRNVGLFLQKELTAFDQSKIEVKGINDLVSYVDKEAERRLIGGLHEILPKAGFISEEDPTTHSPQPHKEYHWIIDPLDGTTNFIHGLPIFSVSIALMRQDELVIGVVYEANKKECFYAWKDGGAYLNGEKIEVSSVPKLSQSLIATGFPYTKFDKMDNYIEMLKYFMQNSHGVRRLGSAAVDLAYVACGRFEGFFEYDLKPWDVAAGALLVKEAGGQVSTFQKTQNFVFGKQILASNAIFDEMLTPIQQLGKHAL